MLGKTHRGSLALSEAQAFDRLLDAALDIGAVFNDYGLEGYLDSAEQVRLEELRGRAIAKLQVALNDFSAERRHVDLQDEGAVALFEARLMQQRAAADRQLRQKAEAIQDPKLRREVLGALES